MERFSADTDNDASGATDSGDFGDFGDFEEWVDGANTAACADESPKAISTYASRPPPPVEPPSEPSSVPADQFLRAVSLAVSSSSSASAPASAPVSAARYEEMVRIELGPVPESGGTDSGFEASFADLERRYPAFLASPSNR